LVEKVTDQPDLPSKKETPPQKKETAAKKPPVESIHNKPPEKESKSEPSEDEIDSEEEAERELERQWNELISKCQRKYVRPVRKMRRLAKHVGRLLEIRESQKRFRNKCLYDSEEANKVMAKYEFMAKHGRKPPLTPYLVKLGTSSDAKEGQVQKMVLRRSAKLKDEFFVGTDTKDPLRIKISIIPEEIPEPYPADIPDISAEKRLQAMDDAKTDDATGDGAKKEERPSQKKEEVSKENIKTTEQPNKPAQQASFLCQKGAREALEG